MHLFIGNINIDFFRTSKNYYPRVLLEKFKYLVKEKRSPNILLMTTDEISSDEEKSDKENSDEKNSSEKFLMKKIILKNKLSIMIMFFFQGAILRMSFLREQFIQKKDDPEIFFDDSGRE